MERKWLIVTVGLIAAFLIGVVVGATIVGVINISYRIEPSPEQAVTVSPTPVSLDLGTIPAKSVGAIDFGNVSRLSLSSGYIMNFTLDLTTIQDFSDFTVRIRIYEYGITYDWQTVFLYPNPWGNSGTVPLDARDYDIHIEVEYSAKDLAETTSGQAVITVSY
jgi:hypothetical protein